MNNGQLPPKMVSTKDVMYIEDILNTTLTLGKKAKHYTTSIEDQQVADKVNEMYLTLKGQYNALLSILQEQQ